MGRPAAPWLEHAYELLIDGRWHKRDDIVEQIMKKVPVGVAYRRGMATSRTGDLGDQVYIERGARHLALSSLGRSVYITQVTRRGVVMLRLNDTPDRPEPLVLERVEPERATHVVVPVEAWDGPTDGVEHVRW